MSRRIAVRRYGGRIVSGLNSFLFEWRNQNMRLIQISVPEEQQDAIVDVLREKQLGYRLTAGTGEQDNEVLIDFVAPADAVEHVLDDLRETGFDRHSYTISLNAEFAHFEHADEVQNRWADSPNKLAPAALRSKAKDLRRNTRSYIWMMVLSAIVATAGLLQGSPAVVVGSMVIAPIVSPVLTASIGALRNDRDMFIDSIHMQAIGLAVAVLTATAFALVLKQFHVVPVILAVEQMDLISLRIAPGILALSVGLAAGAAGAYGLATKGDVALVGVMIAAALIPTAATAGIGLAWGNFVVAMGASLLLILSMIGINIGGTAMLYYLEYRPDQVDESLFSYESTYQALVIAGTLLLVLSTVLVSGFTFYQQSSFEQSVNSAATDVLDQNEYQNLRVMSTSVEYRAQSISDDTMVTITIARTSDEEFTELPDQLAQSISERTDEDVTVQVRFVDFKQSE